MTPFSELTPPTATELPRLVRKDGRHALFVDGAPFLILGAQCGNSSAWRATLDKVWNGDQTDWGLNFASAPQILRVSLGTY